MALRRNIETISVDALFAQYEAGESGVPTAAMTKKRGTADIPFSVLEEHVRRAVAQMDRLTDDRHAADPPADGDELREMRMDAEIGLGILKQAGAELESREELEHFRAKWAPVCVKIMRPK